MSPWSKRTIFTDASNRVIRINREQAIAAKLQTIGAFARIGVAKQQTPQPPTGTLTKLYQTVSNLQSSARSFLMSNSTKLHDRVQQH